MTALARLSSLAAVCLLLGASVLRASPQEYFGIHVVDDQTDRGVPLVELRMTDKVRFYTDSNGYVAFNEPGLMDQDIWFDISSWGYEAPAGMLGYRGVQLRTTAGKVVDVKVHRINIAQRLYRTTGYGIYRDTVLLGRTPPIRNGLLDGKVMGQDTVETAIYNGKMMWLWGDTDRPSFALGNFNTSGALTALPGDLDIDRGFDYEYFTDPNSGFVRGMAQLKRHDSLPVWLDALMVVRDPDGRERLLARYTADKDLVPVEQGLLMFDNKRQLFTEFKRLSLTSDLIPTGHPARVHSGDKDYFYFPNPYPNVRVVADWAHVTDPAAYEGFTCLKAGSSGEGHPVFDRDADNKLVWTWRRGVEPVSPRQVQRWAAAGLMHADESPYQMRNVEDRKPVTVANGSIAWNAYLHKWTMLFGQLGGASNLGEIWFATANAPEGPWVDARKVATHAKKDNNNDLYNPMQHPEFAKDGGRVIYFEGTFVTTFEGNPNPTPRYDYNNLMYKLELDDPRITLPEPPPGLSDATPSPAGP